MLCKFWLRNGNRNITSREGAYFSSYYFIVTTTVFIGLYCIGCGATAAVLLFYYYYYYIIINVVASTIYNVIITI